MNPGSSGKTLCIGILLLGPRGGGISRDARTLADELREIDGITVVEHEVDLAVDGLVGARRALKTAIALRRASVTIVPYGRYRLWAQGRVRLLQLLIVHAGLRRRTVTTLHDVYALDGQRRLERWALVCSRIMAKATVVHGRHEQLLLDEVSVAPPARVIPLPVESRRLPSRESVRADLGVTSEPILTMVGWIHPRKNCELAIRALSLLKQDARLWLVGHAPDVSHADRLRELAVELGVGDRVEISGYVSERELDRRLAATDVGLCPYHDAAASASLSTLLGARAAVVASDLPVTREFQAVAPQAVTIPRSLDPESFAAAIAARLAQPTDATAFEDILVQRSPAAIARQYAELLTDVIAPARLSRVYGRWANRRDRRSP